MVRERNAFWLKGRTVSLHKSDMYLLQYKINSNARCRKKEQKCAHLLVRLCCKTRKHKTAACAITERALNARPLRKCKLTWNQRNGIFNAKKLTKCKIHFIQGRQAQMVGGPMFPSIPLIPYKTRKNSWSKTLIHFNILQTRSRNLFYLFLVLLLISSTTIAKMSTTSHVSGSREK